MENQRIGLVTGASRGIGQAIALRLAADNIFVIGTATTDGGAAAITSSLDRLGQGYRLDVCEEDAIEELVKTISQAHGAPTIIVNNAGITRDSLLLRMKDGDWGDIIDTNLTSIFRMSKACLKGMMKERFGRIVNISSVVAVSGNPGQTNYCAAKAGMIGFTKALAKEVGARNITVNAIAPGFIETDMTDKLSDEHKQALLAGIALNRLGKPQEIASVVSFLCSDGASYITGETIHVNGGLYMT